MEVLRNASSFSLANPLSSSSRPASSFTPVSSATLIHKSPSDRSCTYVDVALKTPPTKESHAQNPISSSHTIASSLLSHNDPYPSASCSRATIQKKTLIVMRNNAAAGYAAALAEMGQSKHILNLIYSDLKKLGTFLQHKQLHSFLLNPSIHDTHKKNILMRLAHDHAFVPYTLKLLNLVVDKKGASLLKDVVKEFEVIYNKIAHMDVAIVLSATEMDAAQLAHIAKRIQGTNNDVRMKNVLESSVIAGYIVKYGKDGSHLIDMSVKA